jgi:hypothetical protein
VTVFDGRREDETGIGRFGHVWVGAGAGDGELLTVRRDWGAEPVHTTLKITLSRVVKRGLLMAFVLPHLYMGVPPPFPPSLLYMGFLSPLQIDTELPLLQSDTSLSFPLAPRLSPATTQSTYKQPGALHLPARCPRLRPARLSSSRNQTRERPLNPPSPSKERRCL